MAEVFIRRAVEGDAAGIARVHVRTWQTAYAGHFPAEELNKLNEAYHQWRELWKTYITAPENGQVLFVAEVDGAVVGFAGGEQERTGDWPFEGELTVIYILEAHQKKGIGRRLLKAAAQALADEGMSSLVVWVLGTSPYRVFFEVLGGRFVSVRDYEIWGKEYKMAGYGWERITDLLEEDGD